jgi:hypothetical protein
MGANEPRTEPAPGRPDAAESPARNRVAPTSDLVAVSQRGLFLGNRGCLHDDRGSLVRRWNGRRWIVCVTEFRGRHLTQWAPGRYTVLFFLDEAVALAAGHRPCAECRREDHRRFRVAWAEATGQEPAGVDEIDRRLHADRLEGRTQRRHARPWAGLPDGTFVDADGDGAGWLVDGASLLRWGPAGYDAVRPRPTVGDVVVLTPSVTVDVLAAGYRPDLHPDRFGSSSAPGGRSGHA